MTLEETKSAIRPGVPAEREAARRWRDRHAKPLGSLGQLEDAITKIAALTGDPDVRLDKRMLFVACADNGVVCQGVSQSDESVTRAVTQALGQRTSTVNYLATQANCTVIPVDIGVKDLDFTDGVLPRKCKNGTDDCSVGPAMTRAECTQAIETGIALALDAKAQGADILLTGEMGIGNTTTACAVASVLLGRDPAALVGRGSGLSNAAFLKKIQVLHKAVARNHPDPEDPVGVLASVGGLDLAALCGLCLGGAFVRLPVLLDGFIADAAALCAVRLEMRCWPATSPPSRGPRRSWRGWACRHLSAPACAWGRAAGLSWPCPCWTWPWPSTTAATPLGRWASTPTRPSTDRRKRVHVHLSHRRLRQRKK